MWCQRNQRAGEDVGQHHVVGRRRRIELFGHNAAQTCGDAVAGCVVGAGQQCLRIDVGGLRITGAELEGGNGEHTRATAVVEHATPFEIGVGQPLQAQCGAGVSAGAERQPWVEIDDDGVGSVYLVAAGADPEPLAEAQRMGMLQPGAHPILIFDLSFFKREIAGLGQVVAQQCAHHVEIDVGIEQAERFCLRPQRRGAGRGFQHRMIGGIDQADRLRAGRQQQFFDEFRVAAVHRQLQPGHAFSVAAATAWISLRAFRDPTFDLRAEIMDVVFAADESLVFHDFLLQGDVGADAVDEHL